MIVIDIMSREFCFFVCFRVYKNDLIDYLMLQESLVLSKCGVFSLIVVKNKENKNIKVVLFLFLFYLFKYNKYIQKDDQIIFLLQRNLIQIIDLGLMFNIIYIKKYFKIYIM